jgi:hypothetical protein
MLYFFPTFGLAPILLAVIVSTTLGVAAYLIVFKTRLFDHLVNKPLVPPYIVIPTSVLALLLAFMASSAWQNTTTAAAALQNEATALNRLGIIAATSPALARELNGDLSLYIQLVEQGEWGKEYNMKRQPEVDQTLSNLYKEAWTIDAGACTVRDAGSQCTTQAMAAEILTEIKQLEAAREQRLSIGSQSNLGYARKWAIIYLLTLVSSITIGAVHRAHRPTAITAIVIWCLCTALVFSMIKLHTHPYKGFNPLRPDFTSLG